jgi:uracil-DNA glycosylase family 4
MPLASPSPAARAPVPERPPAARAPLATARPSPPLRAGPQAERLRVLRDDVIGDCTRCKLHRGRSQIVFGTGNPGASLVFVGEGPGADEDRQGEPFVGRAGQLLTKMIEAMGFARDDVYIANVVKCRPPNNRDPEDDEVEACQGFLHTQLSIVEPQVIVTLGRYAAHALLKTKTPISRLRGTWQRCSVGGVVYDVMPTFHPSYLLRADTNGDKEPKRQAWSDLKQVMARLNP